MSVWARYDPRFAGKRCAHQSVRCCITGRASCASSLKRVLNVPYRGEVVPLYLIVVGQQHDSFCHRLTDEKPVERIFVKLWKRRYFECMRRFDGQFFITSIQQVPAKDACIDLKVVTS